MYSNLTENISAVCEMSCSGTGSGFESSDLLIVSFLRYGRACINIAIGSHKLEVNSQLMMLKFLIAGWRFKLLHRIILAILQEEMT